MLQRIQTVYLAITLVLSILLFFLPMMKFDIQSAFSISEYSYNIVGLRHAIEAENVSIMEKYAVASILLQIVILTVNVIGIILYKNRIFQMRFNVLNILLYMGSYLLFGFFVWTSASKVDANIVFEYCLPITFPLINIILTYLAVRAIGKDEAMVRSLDRIR